MQANRTESEISGQTGLRQYLIFLLGKAMFAVSTTATKEITEIGRLTEAPRIPNFIRGVINLGGTVVPVIDLHARIGIPTIKETRRTRIVIIEIEIGDDEKHDIGLMVDGVSAVIEIPTSDIKPPPSLGSQIRTEFISGIGKVCDEFVIILDVDQVLEMEAIALAAAVSSESTIHETSQSGLAA